MSSGPNEVRLTRRERQVCLLLIEGLSYDAIAHELHITKATVSSFLSRVYNKTGAPNGRALSAWVMQHRSTLEQEGACTMPRWAERRASPSVPTAKTPSPAGNGDTTSNGV